MVAAAITVTTLVTQYPTLPVTALSLDIAFVAGDASNGNDWSASNGDVLVMWNNLLAGSTRTVTITSVIDAATNRTGDITAYSMAVTIHSAVRFSNIRGWANTSTGKILATPSHLDVKFAVLR